MDRTNQDETTASRTRMPRHARERQMIEAAIESFGIQGFHGASMDQIALDAGISKPMLYAYFDSKDGLYLACLRRAGLDLIDSVRSSFNSELNAEAQLRNGFMAFLGYIKDHRAAWNLVRNETLLGQPVFPEEMEHIRALLRQMVRELLFESSLTHEVDRGELDDAALPMAAMLLGATEAIANWWITEAPNLPVEVPAAHLMSMCWYGTRQLWSGGDWYPVSPGFANELDQFAANDALDTALDE